MTKHTRVPRHQLPPRARIAEATWTANGYVFKTVRVTEDYVCARVVTRIETEGIDMSHDEPTLPDKYKCGCDVVEYDGESDLEQIKPECPEHGEPPDWATVFD